MSILSILEFPDPRLRTVAKPVKEVDKALGGLVDDMFETMYEAHGVGLAATQVNVHQRIIVIDISEEKDQPVCLINPEIMDSLGEEESDEGCLSVPGIFEPVTRAETIKVKALDKRGESFELEADGLLAVCIQHEMDHLLGKLFVDYLSPLKRQRIKKKMQKMHKREK
ncbi:peptide deformylase [methanotrophic endosymbiont of Bathymodiolus puteoserpentis (Logatchev)]|uniref:peptide deformylase n=1 Tax=methanotrophic endosymbiont of Bathymodiolus puteoserpentis (Logatchev) TaxID=343235 RepID=UPI0013CACD81|nr:peptide deformylase [methanotrophic endosymbiont of Bathymodiolus puteoserpentis (Logatchev)]SHE19983.1 Peptide deformylase [methanotrophic endosymbiont of Bathymodiolus puteoserpentis (Logatchev)]